MALHYSTLAQKIPWTEEPGGPQFTGSLRVGQDSATSLSLFTFMYWRRKWQPTPVFLPGESLGWGSLVGCHLWGRTESDTTEATQQHAKSLLLLGRFSSCHAWASRCSGFSCSRAWALGCARGLSSCGTRAQQLWFLRSRAQAQWCGTQTQLLHGTWDLPRSGIKLMFPALAGGFFTTDPLRKALDFFFYFFPK